MQISDSLSCCFQAGIGTDATMHEHIKKLLDRCYATKDANARFSPTNLVRFMPYESSIILLHTSYYVVYMIVVAIIVFVLVCLKHRTYWILACLATKSMLKKSKLALCDVPP